MNKLLEVSILSMNTLKQNSKTITNGNISNNSNEGNNQSSTSNTKLEKSNSSSTFFSDKKSLESEPVKLKIYKKQLKYLYKRIDSISNLLWSHENHLLGKRLRSENGIDDHKLKWMNKKTTQIGYGEITMVKFFI